MGGGVSWMFFCLFLGVRLISIRLIARTPHLETFTLEVGGGGVGVVGSFNV